MIMYRPNENPPEHGKLYMLTTYTAQEEQVLSIITFFLLFHRWFSWRDYSRKGWLLKANLRSMLFSTPVLR
uniref:Putative salivary lipocalin n=1 Tax=Ixodes ricinus TaxID=34613 RepID=A0A0K8R713_IXORI